jgi:hypothetical protein
MKEHSRQGISGGLAVVIMLAVSLAMPFVTSAEVGGLYARRGLPEPVRAWTGLWVLLPAVLGYLPAAAAALGVLLLLEQPPAALVLAAGAAGYLAVLLPCAWVWFRRTNEALNNYWGSLV